MNANASGRVLFGNGRVVTLDPEQPEVEAVLVDGGAVVACGAFRELREDAAATTMIFDLEGATLRPAYHDAHTHLAEASAELAQLDLREVTRFDDARARIVTAARAASDAWVRGFGWSDDAAIGKRLTCAALDEVAPEVPVLIGRRDGHAVVANTAALHALAMSDRADEGWLFEADAARARAAAPTPSRAQRRAALAHALENAAALGIARLEDVVDADALDLYASLRDAGELRCRIGGWIPLDLDEATATELRHRFPPGDPQIEVATRKVFVDGTLGARTAALRQPYADAPETSGTLRVEREELAARVAAVDAAGWAVAFHVIGDAAVRVALDVLEALPATPRDRPHRLEHAQIVDRTDLARIARIRAVASIQPSHHALDASFASLRLGDRPQVIPYPAASLIRTGAIVALGSDWPIGALDPAMSLHAIQSRTDGEACNPTTALIAATQGPARAAGRPPTWGRIAPGAPADFVVLSAADSSILTTIVSGRVAWTRHRSMDS